jgi:sigma-B regulation protein RsbU (phosphoserine phosphatase)
VALGGHPHPLVIRAGGEVEDIGTTAPIVGWQADTRYEDVDADLAAGDVMVLYTDGLLEAVAGHGETDDKALRDVLAPFAGCDAEAVAAALDAAIGTDEIGDDAAFLVVRAR